MSNRILVYEDSRVAKILELLIKVEDAETVEEAYKHGREATQLVKDFVLIQLGQVAGRDLSDLLSGLHDARVIAEGGL